MANNTPGQVFTPGGSTESPTEAQPQNLQPSPEAADSLRAQQKIQQSPLAPPNVQQSSNEVSPASNKDTSPRVETYTSATTIEPSAQSATVGHRTSEVQPDYTTSPYALNEDETQPYVSSEENSDAIIWTASEYIAHHKSTSWYVVLVAATVALIGLVFWITEGDIVSMIVVGLVAIVFGMYAARKPKEQQYAIGPDAIGIGSKIYLFSDLKSYAILEEGPFSSIVFMPLKRFMPLLTMYYDPKDEERIIQLLSRSLPNEQRNHDKIDRIMKKIRF